MTIHAPKPLSAKTLREWASGVEWMVRNLGAPINADELLAYLESQATAAELREAVEREGVKR